MCPAWGAYQQVAVDGVIRGSDDCDCIFAGERATVIYGGAGDDWIFSGELATTRSTSLGLPAISSTYFARFTATGSHVTHVYGESGADVIFGSPSSDTLYGGPDGDVIYAGDSSDVVYGGLGDDTLFGQSGDDALYGGFGKDLLLGGEGDDGMCSSISTAWADCSGLSQRNAAPVQCCLGKQGPTLYRVVTGRTFWSEGLAPTASYRVALTTSWRRMPKIWRQLPPSRWTPSSRRSSVRVCRSHQRHRSATNTDFPPAEGAAQGEERIHSCAAAHTRVPVLAMNLVIRQQGGRYIPLPPDP
eukprot:scaffold3611_cov364-Prasinococcus_capsulatus_cf.AAC.9